MADEEVEERNNDGRGQGEDRMLQEGERVILDRSSVLTDSREAPSYASYLTLMSSYLLASVQLLRSIQKQTIASAKRTKCVWVCDVSVLPINRVEFQGVNSLFHCIFHVGRDSFFSALRQFAIKKGI